MVFVILWFVPLLDDGLMTSIFWWLFMLWWFYIFSSECCVNVKLFISISYSLSKVFCCYFLVTMINVEIPESCPVRIVLGGQPWDQLLINWFVHWGCHLWWLTVRIFWLGFFGFWVFDLWFEWCCTVVGGAFGRLGLVLSGIVRSWHSGSCGVVGIDGWLGEDESETNCYSRRAAISSLHSLIRQWNSIRHFLRFDIVGLVCCCN